jgi:uncharacterized protein YqhQ
LAINLLFVNIFHNLLILLASKIKGQIKFDYRIVLKYLLILFISAIIFYFTPNLKLLSNYWWLMLIPLYIALTYGLLFFTGMVTKPQVFEMLHILNLKLAYKYIKDEVNE